MSRAGNTLVMWIMFGVILLIPRVKNSMISGACTGVRVLVLEYWIWCL